MKVFWFLGLLLVACSREGMLLDLSVGNLPEDVTDIEVGVYLEKEDLGRQDVPRISRFTVRLPPDAKGNATILVGGHRGDRCYTRAGKIDIALNEPIRQRVYEIQLMPVSDSCKLEIDVGPGDGLVKTEGLSCDNSCVLQGERRCPQHRKCEGHFRGGQQVILQAEPRAGFALGQWRESCVGTELRCTVEIRRDGPTKVRALLIAAPSCGTNKPCWEHPSSNGFIRVQKFYGQPYQNQGVWATANWGDLPRMIILKEVGDSFQVIGEMPQNVGLPRESWGVSPTEYWSHNGIGQIWRVLGSSVTKVYDMVDWPGDPMPTIVRGATPEEAWIIGMFGLAKRYRGGVWQKFSSGTTQGLNALWGAHPNDVWAVAGNNIIHWDGAVWRPASAPAIESDLRLFYGTDAKNVWLAGSNGVVLYWNGSLWKVIDSEARHEVFDLWASGPGDVWVLRTSADGGSKLRRFNGQNWSEVSDAPSLSHIWGSSPDKIWGSNDDRLLRLRHPTWRPAFGGPLANLRAIWGSSAEDIWASGEHGIMLHFDGIRWTEFPTDTDQTFYALWGNSAQDVWAVGDGLFYHWDGVSWKKTSVSGEGKVIRAIFGNGATNIWAVGDAGTVLRWDGKSWSFLKSPNANNLDHVFTSSEKDAWISGDLGGDLLHWDGQHMAQVSTGTKVRLRGLWGRNANEIWACGHMQNMDGTYVATLLQKEGANWVPQTPPNLRECEGIFGGNDNQLWLYSSSTGFHRLPNGKWRNFTGGNGLWGISSRNIWVVGDRGVIQRVPPPM